MYTIKNFNQHSTYRVVYLCWITFMHFCSVLSLFLVLICFCCECFESVGLVPERASASQKIVHNYLSAAICKWFAYGSVYSITYPSSLASFKSKMVHLSDAGLPGCGEKGGCEIRLLLLSYFLSVNFLPQIHAVDRPRWIPITLSHHTDNNVTPVNNRLGKFLP